MSGNRYNRGTRGQATGQANANLRRQIRRMQRESSAMLKIGPTAGDPPTISSNSKFVDRIVCVPPSDGLNDTITVGLICQALQNSVPGSNVPTTGPRGDFYILKIQIWAAGGVDSQLTATFLPNQLLINASPEQGAADPVSAIDYGTGSSRAGIKCQIPALNARLQDFETGNTDIVATKIYSGTGSSSTAGWGACHVTVRQKL